MIDVLRSTRGLWLTALVLCLATAAAAFEVPRSSAMRELAFRHPDLSVGLVLRPATGARGEIPARAMDALTELGVEPTAAFLDPRGGRWATLLPGTPLLPGDGLGNDLSFAPAQRPTTAAELETAAWRAFADYLSLNRSAIGVDPADVPRGTVTVHDDGRLIQIVAPRVHRGIPVRGAAVSGVVGHGNLTLLGITRWGDIAVSPIETLDRAAAEAVAAAFLADLAATAGWGKAGLVYQPTSAASFDTLEVGHGYAHRLAWVLRPSWPDDHGEWELLVDAHSGEVLAFEDRANYASSREIVGGVFPVSNDGVGSDGSEQVYPMPFADLGGGQVSDTGGNAYCLDGSISTQLQGPYIVIDDTCGAVSETTSGDVLDLGTGPGTDCDVPAGASPGNTHSSRSAFYEINRMKEIGRSHLPDNVWLQGDLPVYVNIFDTCNASGSSAQLRFFRSGGGCSNTGEIAGVFDHEWGHGMDMADAWPGISNPGEGIADIFAALRLDTSCIGRNFRPTVCTGFGDACTECTGVRDIDWAKRVSGLPHDLAWIDANCGSGGYTPCGGSTHCEGAVYAEAVWDLYTRDLASHYSMDRRTSQELTLQLAFRGGGAVGAWFTCVPGAGTGDGCNADGGYLNFLAADDDDGDLGNGTPHMQAIHDAFDRHGIACSSPAVIDSGCAGTPSEAPTVTATAIDRGVNLSWNAVSGATAYRVYRGDGVSACAFAKVPVAETTATAFTDTGLRNGDTSVYIVIPLGPSDVCFGPASACASATPTAGGALIIEPASAAFAITGGDGDAFVDNCETVEVTFDVLNVGGADQSNVRVAAVTSPSHPAVDATVLLPPPFATTLPASCGTAQGAFSFVATGLAHGDTLDLVVEITSDELAGQTRAATLDITLVESDLSTVGSPTFDFETDLQAWAVESGTFDRTDHGSGGGGDGSDASVDSSAFAHGACDRIRSPAFQVTATSTLELWSSYDIEAQSSSTWYDRANVAVVTAGGERTVITPDGGRPYNADSSGPGSYSGCNDPEPGWADTATAWATSSWSAAAFGAPALDGTLVQLEVTYATDGALANRGFWFDQVSLTDVITLVADPQDNACFSALVFADGFESGGVSGWSGSGP